MKKTRQIISTSLVIALLLVGCVNQLEQEPIDTFSASEVTTKDYTQNISEQSDKKTGKNIVSVEGPYGELSVTIPENWGNDVASVDSNKMMYGIYGFIIKPQDSSDGQIELF